MRFPELCGLLLANVRGLTPDAVAKYFWHEAPVAERLEITQVYGYLICPETRRVLIQDDGEKFTPPGGTPEPFDADLVDTLVREAFEENQVLVNDAVYLGYQEVHRSRREPYAQVRMVGLIGAFDERRPDPTRTAAGRTVG